MSNFVIKDKDKHRYSRNNSRLTEKDITDIRKRRDAGETFETIHKDYLFVNIATIRQAVWNQKYYGRRLK